MKTVIERIRNLEKLRETNSFELKEILSKSLKDKSPTVRGFAVEIIGDIGLSDMTKNLLPMLKDINSEVRMLAIESLGKLEDGKLYVNDIAKCLKDKSELVRVSAAEFLGEIGNSATLDNLEASLSDKSGLVRRYLAEAIGSIGQKKSAKVLQEYLLNEEDESAKVGFYIGLYKLNKKDFLENLINLLDSEDYGVRCAVANSLSSLNLSASEIPRVINILKTGLEKEKTVAARSSIESTLDYLEG